MADSPFNLIAFRAEHGRAVASWVVSRDELFLVAPLTSPPLTAEKVCNWTCAAERGYVYLDETGEPFAYSELNPMPHTPGGLWIGHFVVAPPARGCSVGRSFLKSLLDEGFVRRGAKSVGLVVFPRNEAAVRCYRSVGMTDVGPQYRRFPGALRRHELRYMQITRAEYRHSRKTWWPDTSVRVAEPTYA